MTIWKDNLGDLSREIRHLQDQSTSMGIKLNNRRSVREYLSQLVDELLIPEEMIEGRVQTFHACDCNIYASHNASLKLCSITEPRWKPSVQLNWTNKLLWNSFISWIEKFVLFGNKLITIQRHAKMLPKDRFKKWSKMSILRKYGLPEKWFVENIDWSNNRWKVVDNLRLKSSNRIRTFLFEKIYQFRKPLANYHIPQNTMLRFRFFYEFLLANERPTAQEIKDEYLDTVSKVYYSYFRSYLQRLMKLKFSETATKLDMLGTVVNWYTFMVPSRWVPD